MIAVSLIGFKKTGKTSLAVALGKELRERGIRAAAMKHSHQANLEKADTDTDQMLKVFNGVAAFGGEETALLWPHTRFMPDLIPLMNADVFIVEGGKDQGWLPRVLLLNSADEADKLGRELAIATYGDVVLEGLPNAKTPKELVDIILEKGFSLPSHDCGHCGRDSCRDLAEEVVAGQAKLTECQAEQREFVVTVNGANLPMNKFVQGVFTASLLGMLKECKGYAPGNIEVTLTGD